MPAFLGARGLAAAIVWDVYPEPVDPFHTRAPLMIMPGALTGTVASYSGRTSVCGFSSQCYPYPWFTRSKIGADWGACLKRVSYDGLIVTGTSKRPVQILIHDDEVRVVPAADLWGLDTLARTPGLSRLGQCPRGHDRRSTRCTRASTPLTARETSGRSSRRGKSRGGMIR